MAGIGLATLIVIGVATVEPLIVATRALDDAAVRIDVLDSEGALLGHGSGVMLKDGYALTAAHVAVEVVGDGKTIKGKEGRSLKINYPNEFKVETLWINETYDVALLHVDGYTGPYRSLACRNARLTEPVTSSGFPMNFPHPITSKGIVSSRMLNSSSDWQEQIIIDANGRGGISGAGVLDELGKVIGLFVGTYFADVIKVPGRGMQPDQQVGLESGYNVMVPSSTVCKLLARPIA